jgi:hypothetical protein
VACVVPPPLKLDTADAGANSPPALTSVRGTDGTELAYPGGTVAFERGKGSMSLTLVDADLGDTLYVQVFVDYGRPDPTPPRATCKAAPGTASERSTICDLGGLCQTADVGVERSMVVEVYDRAVLDTGTPQFRALPSGGLASSRQYFLQCQAPT